MRIGFDVDGVLANFERGFLHCLNLAGAEVATEILDDPRFPQVWDWPREVLKLDRDTISKAQQLAHESPYFWRNLPEVQGPETVQVIRELNDLNRKHDVYFITNRYGRLAKYQTECWLRDRGFFNPTVILTPDKGLAARVLDLGVYVDDRPQNCTEVAFANPQCRVYVFDRPYNQECACERTTNLREMLANELRDGDSDRSLVPAGAEIIHHRYRV